jgi:hypothetical protein
LKRGDLLDAADDELTRQFRQQRSKLADQVAQRIRALELADQTARK